VSGARTGDLETATATALLAEYLRERRADLSPAFEVAALSGDASTRRYFRLTDGGRSLVAAVYPAPFEPDELSFLGVRALLEAFSLPVPAVVDVDGPRGIVVQEDLGDRTLQELLRSVGEHEEEDLYREAVDEIAVLQREAGRGARSAPCFRIAFDLEKLTWELHYFLKHFVEGHRGIDLSVEHRARLSESFHVLCEEIASWPHVLCHRDYHSRNLMRHRGLLYWIDFQDARMGPATYDLASLLRDAYVDVPGALREALVEEFRQKAAPAESREVFRRRFDLMCVQRNLKALGTFGYMAAVRENPVYLPYIPRTLEHARENLVRYRELEPLRRTLAVHIEELA
jgi:hypothetical protein